MPSRFRQSLKRLIGSRAGAAETGIPALLSVSLFTAHPATAAQYGSAATLPQILPFHFIIEEAPPAPVIDAATPGAQDNKFGFEGGVIERVGFTYYLLTNELFGDPLYTRIRGAIWSSADAVHWTRLNTLFTADWGVQNVAHLWGPMAVYNDAEDRWNLFPDSTPAGGSASTIARYVSQTPGREGIAGPYKESGTLMTGDRNADPWADNAGVVSFYPFQVDVSWYAFYGSHWKVGIAQARDLSGPWTRVPNANPAPIESVFIENPIVTRIGKWYVAIYDGGQYNRGIPDNYQPNGHYCGYSCSLDGVHWMRGGRIPVQPFGGPANWADDIRTPLCLIPRGSGRYLMLYTAGKGGYRLGPHGGGKMPPNQYWPVGEVTLRLVDGP